MPNYINKALSPATNQEQAEKFIKDFGGFMQASSEVKLGWKNNQINWDLFFNGWANKHHFIMAQYDSETYLPVGVVVYSIYANINRSGIISAALIFLHAQDEVSLTQASEGFLPALNVSEINSDFLFNGAEQQGFVKGV